MDIGLGTDLAFDVMAPPISEVADDDLRTVLHLLPSREHTWSLRDVEYDNGFSLNRFECESCDAVRFT